MKQQIKWLDQLITATRKSLNAIKVSDDRPVRSSKRKNGYQYYLQKDDGKLEYVKEKDIYKVKRIVQRDYYAALLDNLLTVRYRIERFTKIYDIGSIARVYDDLSEARHALLKINQFDKMGIEVGKELVISMESDEIPLDIKQIEKKIKEYLL